MDLRIKFILVSFLVIFFQLIGLNGIAQIVNIPDINFKNKLIALGVDLNSDNEISYAEAEAVTDLDVSSGFGALDTISDMTGIEAFINLINLNCSGNSISSLSLNYNTALKELNCYQNLLTNLDVSTNDSLEILGCSVNYLSTLDVSNNLLLKNLNCGLNEITYLDLTNNILLEELRIFGNDIVNFNVSNNVNLKYLECTSANLTSLDVTQNLYLTELLCATNQLTFLDISHNINLTNLVIFGMPSLTQVCVWVLPFPDSTSVQVTSFNSINIVYEICDVGTDDIRKSNSSFPYPIPASDNIIIDFHNPSEIEIMNSEGRIVKYIYASKFPATIDISELPAGIYVMKGKSKDEIVIRKFIKR